MNYVIVCKAMPWNVKLRACNPGKSPKHQDGNVAYVLRLTCLWPCMIEGLLCVIFLLDAMWAHGPPVCGGARCYSLS